MIIEANLAIRSGTVIDGAGVHSMEADVAVTRRWILAVGRAAGARPERPVRTEA